MGGWVPTLPCYWEMLTSLEVGLGEGREFTGDKPWKQVFKP